MKQQRTMTMKITEADLSTFVEDCLTRFGWWWYHPRPARIRIRGTETYRTAISGHKGYFDYTCVRGERLLFIELKSEKGRLSTDQLKWFNKLEDCQRTIILKSLNLKGSKAEAKLTKGTQFMTTPEIYCWRPSDSLPDGGKILECLR